MKALKTFFRGILLLLISICLQASGGFPAAAEDPSPPAYEMTLRETWIPMPDGVRPAADLFLPQNNFPYPDDPLCVDTYGSAQDLENALPGAEATRSFAQLMREFTKGYYDLFLHIAVSIGLHEALDDAPGIAIGQLQNALVNNVRILFSIGLQTGGMSIAESEQLFREKTFCDPQSAHQEALRGLFDPGYLFYSIGKLMIRKLRDDWLAIHPGNSLRDFHDALLSFGTSPLRLVRKAMLGDADDGRLFH